MENRPTCTILFSLLCSPEFTPQMVGGEGPPGLVTLKVSVRQLVISATEIRGAGAVVAIGMLFTMPERGSRLATEVLTVLGPLMVKVSKSKRICGTKNRSFFFFVHIAGFK